MNGSKIVSALLMILALIIGISAVLLSFGALEQKPVLVTPPGETAELARQVMDGVCQGDFDAVSSRLQGTPDLGLQREPEDQTAKLLWAEFLKSFTYEIKGEAYAADPGMALDMTVTYLDYSSVIDTLGDRAGALLKEKAETAEDPSSLYDENNQYRQELVDQVLTQAVQDALQTGCKTITEDLTIRMVYEQGKWWVVPDPSLIHAITGGMAD